MKLVMNRRSQDGRTYDARGPPSKISRHAIRAGMRTSFLAMIIALLSGSAVLADPANRTKLDYATLLIGFRRRRALPVIPVPRSVPVL